MPDILKHKVGSVTMEAPYFSELLMSEENGRLPQDPVAHALWYYYYLATNQYLRAKANIVEENELSLIFNRETAENIFASVANMYGVESAKMIRFWDIVDKQRIALKMDNALPEEFKFKFWGN